MTEKKNNSRGTIIGLSIIIVLLIGYIIYLSMNKQTLIDEKVQLGIEKYEVMKDLQDLQVQFDTLVSSNDTMQAKIHLQQEKIAEMLVQIERHKGDAYTIRKLKKETETLRTVMVGYLHTIDSLNTLNIALRTENKEIKGALVEEQKQSQKLLKKTEDLSEVVNKGSKLQALDLYAEAIKIRSNGKQMQTDKADKAEKIKSCFVLSDNKIATSGLKDIYFRIISPEGKVLNDENSAGRTFTYEGVSGLYTMIRKVDYNNELLDVCIYWDIPSVLSPGLYIVELYLEEVLIGKTSMELK
jgi:hypothetical protein